MTHRAHAYSIRRILQLSYCLLLLVMFVSFLSYYVVSQSRSVREKAFQALQLRTQQAVGYVEDEIATLSTVAQNVAYSNLVKDRFLSYIQQENGTTPSEAYQQLEDAKVLTDLLTAIIGPKQPVAQIYLYALDGKCFGVGRSPGKGLCALPSQIWYRPLLQQGAQRYISCSTDPTLDHFYTAPGETLFFSYAAFYYNSFNQIQGVIEVKNPASLLTDKLDALGSLYGERIYLYDESGTVLYGPQGSENYYDMLRQTPGTQLQNDIFQFETEDEVSLFHAEVPYTGFTVVVAIEHSLLLQPVFSYLRSSTLIFAIIAAAVLILSFFASRIITTPITRIYQQIAALPVRMEANPDAATLPPIHTHLLELDALYASLSDMQREIGRMMTREVVLHQQEMQSRMLALQSQMNPHFLYNSLAAIQSMADDGMDAEIQSTCQTMSRILRYIASDKELLVPL